MINVTASPCLENAELPASADPRLLKIAAFLRRHGCAAEVDPLGLDPVLLPHLFILVREIVEGTARLKIRLTGTAIDEIFGRKVAGCCMEDFMHGPRSADVLQSFHLCALQGQPIWMRQIVALPGRHSRFIEAVAIHLAPDRIYGGLIEGHAVADDGRLVFDRAWLPAV